MDDNTIQKGIIGLIVVMVIAAVVWVVSTPVDPTGGKEVSIDIVEDDLTIGDSDATVTIVKYSDFQCPACAAYDAMLTPLLAEYEDSEVQYVYRHFPLRAIHEYADLAAQATEAAAELGEFQEMKTELFLNQAEWSQLDSEEEVRDQFVKYAKDLKLDTDEFETLLDSDDVKSKVERDYQSGVAIGVNSTPTFILNETLIENPSRREDFKAMIDAELSGDTTEE